MSAKHKKRAPKTSRRVLTRAEMSVTREIRYIIERAQALDRRMVTFGPLLFFSTETGDVWLLDPGDGLSLCLAREGEPLPIQITETATSFGIGWNSGYRIENDLFIQSLPGGRDIVFFGYPTREIESQWREHTEKRWG